MLRCLTLAKMGLGSVAPNPLVGAVIVHKGKIIGEGFHEKYGESHAEVNAINSVVDKSLLKESTIYVALEPCSHFGKTPPCANLIIDHQFKKVVIACRDPFSEVNGKGIELLKDAKIEVVEGILEKEAIELNRRFFTVQNKKRPYVILKWAETSDGFIDRKRLENETGINWITSPETRQLVHKWRSEEMAVLVGKNTIYIDNSLLTVREWKGGNPVRIVIDPNLELPLDKSIFDSSSNTLILNTSKNEVSNNLKFIKLTDFSSESMLNCLYNEGIQSVMIEGGASTLQSFIDSNCWDEARVLSSKVNFIEGMIAPKLKSVPTSIDTFGEDKIKFFRNI